MKQLIKNLGLIIFVIALVILAAGIILQETTSNAILLVSGALIVAGLFVHVIVNKIIE